MKVVFLGTQDATPDAENSGTSFVVGSKATSVLVDVTGTWLQGLLKAGLDPLDLDALVITHFHPDHAHGLPSLLQAFLLMKRAKPFAIHANEPTCEKARELCRLFDLPTSPPGYRLSWDASSAWTEGDLRTELFPVEHSLPTCGTRFLQGDRSIVYSADTRPCQTLAAAARGAGLLVHEASGLAGRETVLNAAGHSSARQAGLAARQAGVGRLFLCHFGPRSGGSADVFRREAAEASGCETRVPDLFRPYEIGPSSAPA